MATVGQPLTAPEAGWRRYDDSDAKITYVGNWGIGSSTSNPNMWNINSKQTNSGGVIVQFNFTGTRIRLIGIHNTNKSTSIDIFIDGKKIETISQNGTVLYQTLDFEVINLSNNEHSLEIVNNNAGSYYLLDAIDIDENGELRPYNPILEESEEALLRITMIDSSEREYKLSKAYINDFIRWFTRTIGTGTSVYVLNKMTGNKEYLAFDKIISFEVIEIK